MNEKHPVTSGAHAILRPLEAPVSNPPVPYAMNVSLSPNKMIFISGIPHPNPRRSGFKRGTSIIDNYVQRQTVIQQLLSDQQISTDAFTIYLQNGSRYEPQEVAMCVDARFSFYADHNVIVVNHKQGGWGWEQRNAPYFPFTPNSNFDIIILVEHHGFKVAVNNQHLLEFRHRIKPLDRIDTLRVDGDVRLTHVRLY